jgi:peptidyl-prolyl cis-trans isomerase SurA
MKKINKLIIILFIICLHNINSFALENKILLKVNDEIITSMDIYYEINYLKALNNELVNLEDEKIFEIAKRVLINEKIKENEIKKYTDNLIIEDKFIDPFIKQIYSNINIISIESFIEYLNQFDLKIDNIKKKISLEIIWNDLIFSKFASSLKVDENDIRNKLNTNLSKNTKEFLLSEIIFNVSDISNLKTKEILINNDIKEKGFRNAVLIHSIADTAQKNGGQIGWLKEDSLNNQIKKELVGLNKGQHTKPILIPGGFLILKIDDSRIIENKEFNFEQKVQEIIQIKKTEQLNSYSNIYFNKIKKEYTITNVK